MEFANTFARVKIVFTKNGAGISINHYDMNQTWRTQGVVLLGLWCFASLEALLEAWMFGSLGPSRELVSRSGHPEPRLSWAKMLFDVEGVGVEIQENGRRGGKMVETGGCAKQFCSGIRWNAEDLGRGCEPAVFRCLYGYCMCL